MNERTLTCIVCPNGCLLTVDAAPDGTVNVGGNMCPKGVKFARDEIIDPVRTFTGTAATSFKDHPVEPVRTAGDVKIKEIARLAEYVNSLVLDRRYSPGEVIEENVLGTGAALIATGDMKEDTL